MEISASASRYQHRHWNWYWHRHCQNFIFASEVIFWKNRMFFFELWYIISTTLLQIHISLRFPTHPFKSVYWCSRKSLFGLSEASVVLWENNYPENFRIVPSEKSSAESFLSTLAGPPGTFPKSSLEQLFCR